MFCNTYKRILTLVRLADARAATLQPVQLRCNPKAGQLLRKRAGLSRAVALPFLRSNCFAKQLRLLRKKRQEAVALPFASCEAKEAGKRQK